MNVIAPENEGTAVKGLGIEAKTSSVEEIPKPVEKLAEPSPPMLDNDADPDASIFTNEMPLQLEPSKTYHCFSKWNILFGDGLLSRGAEEGASRT